MGISISPTFVTTDFASLAMRENRLASTARALVRERGALMHGAIREVERDVESDTLRRTPIILISINVDCITFASNPHSQFPLRLASRPCPQKSYGISLQIMPLELIESRDMFSAGRGFSRGSSMMRGVGWDKTKDKTQRTVAHQSRSLAVLDLSSTEDP